jgi:putative alpha-1,2-mannosidase
MTIRSRVLVVPLFVLGCSSGHGGNGGPADAPITPPTGDAATDGGSDVPLPDLTGFVDPIIGTDKAPNVEHPVDGGAGGSVFPGATVPWGMIQFSPDTPNGSPSGYGYYDSSITGFSLTHFSGAGCPNGGDLPLLPAIDPNASSFPFHHNNEHAAPGYYDVTSDDHVRVELTTTARTGMARITFPAGGQAALILDASRSQTLGKITALTIDQSGGDTLTGYTKGGAFCNGGTFPIYFTAQFDKPWKSIQIQGGKVVAMFDAGATVTVKIGLSYFGQSGAKQNLDTENPGFDFDGVRAAAKKAWNVRLNAIEVDGGSDDAKKMFYTALYHSLIHPNIYSDVNGEYMGFDGVQHTTASGRVQYANFSGWDIYRSQVHLMALLFPDVWSDVVQSLVLDAKQCGAFPKWSQNNVEDNVMAGDPGSLIVANAYAFGARDFDTKGAVQVMRDMTLQPGASCNGATELPVLDAYVGMGFAAAVGDGQLARIAGARSANWRNQLNIAVVPNPSIEPRNSDGSWPTPLGPAEGFNNGFTEASAEQYTWYVPQDLRGLFDAFGGNSKVVARLDTFFTSINAGGQSAFCYIGNEPDFTTPFLYEWAGAPAKTQDVVYRSLTEAFSTGAGGLPGNDDLGATSSLIAWFMIGLYPEIPGAPGVAIASPAFGTVKMHLPKGKTFAISTTGTGHYVQSAKLNGAASSRLWLPVDTILAGGSLDFVLGGAPSAWGTAADDAPPSFGPGQFGSMADAANVFGISSDSATADANFDGYGWSYSSQALAAAGATAGGTVSFGGASFPWPAAGAAADNLVTIGQTLTFAGQQPGGKLAFLGAASAGPSTGTVVLHYTDGSSANASLTFSDWTLGGNKVNPDPSNQIALTSTYRHNAAGQKDNIKTYVFYAAIPLDGGKTLASVTLPGIVSHGRIHVFSAAVSH